MVAFLWIPRRLVQPPQWMCSGGVWVYGARIWVYEGMHPCVLMWKPEQDSCCLSPLLSAYCLERGSVIEPGTFLCSWLTMRFWDPPMSTPTTLGLQAHKVLPGYLHGYWRFELRPLYWWHKGSYRATFAASHSSLMTVVFKPGYVLLHGFLWKRFSFTAF